MLLDRLFLLLAVILFAGPAWSGSGPSISFDQEELDYGRVAYGSTVTEHFRLINKGDEPLVITKVRADCGCTKTFKGPTEVPPNGKSEIVTEFDTTDLSPGRKRKHIYVSTNDPKRPQIVLTLYADIVRELVVEPPTFAKQIDRQTGPVSFQFKIRNLSGLAHVISGIRLEEPGAHALLDPGRVEVPANSTSEFKIVLDLPKESARLFHAGKVILSTDHPREKEIELRYVIQISNHR